MECQAYLLPGGVGSLTICVYGNVAEDPITRASRPNSIGMLYFFKQRGLLTEKPRTFLKTDTTRAIPASEKKEGES